MLPTRRVPKGRQTTAVITCTHFDEDVPHSSFKVNNGCILED